MARAANDECKIKFEDDTEDFGEDEIMTNKDRTASSLQDLESALDTFGADRTRWPAPVRLALSSLIASNAQAQQMVREAEAFDRILDQAPSLSNEAIKRLAGRIEADAVRQPRLVSSGSAATATPRGFGFGGRQHGMAAAALAASLVLGILVGQTSALNPAAELLIGQSNTTSDTSTASLLANVDEAEGLLDEDLL